MKFIIGQLVQSQGQYGPQWDIDAQDGTKIYTYPKAGFTDGWKIGEVVEVQDDFIERKTSKRGSRYISIKWPKSGKASQYPPSPTPNNHQFKVPNIPSYEGLNIVPQLDRIEQKLNALLQVLSPNGPIVHKVSKEYLKNKYPEPNLPYADSPPPTDDDMPPEEESPF